MHDNEHMREIVVRPPLAGRAFAAVVASGFGVFVVIMFALAASRGQDVSGAPIAFGMAVFAGALGYRMAALSFRASGQELVIHNYLRTRHVPVSDVERLDLGRATVGSQHTVHVITTAGAIPIDAMAVPNRISGRMATRDADRLERLRQELAGWLTGATSLGPYHHQGHDI